MDNDVWEISLMCLVERRVYLNHMTETMNDKEYEQDSFYQNRRAAVAAIALLSCPRKHLK